MPSNVVFFYDVLKTIIKCIENYVNKENCLFIRVQK